MNVLEPTLEHARRELAGIADALSEDDDLVVGYARAVWSCLVEPGDRVAGALIATCGPVRALEIAVATTGGAEVAHAAGIELGELDKARTRWHPRRGDVAERIARFREIRAVHLVSGAQDLRVEVEGASMKEVADFVAQKLSGVDRVTATSTHFLLRRYKDDGQLLTDPEPDQRLSVMP